MGSVGRLEAESARPRLTLPKQGWAKRLGYCKALCGKGFEVISLTSQPKPANISHMHAARTRTRGDVVF